MILTNLDQFPNLPDAACSPMTADLFHVTLGKSTQPAKAICNLCPEKAACLQWAIDHKETEGTWGGMSPLERDRLVKGEPLRQPRRTMTEARAVEVARRPKNRQPSDPHLCRDCKTPTVGFSHRCPGCKTIHERARKKRSDRNRVPRQRAAA